MRIVNHSRVAGKFVFHVSNYVISFAILSQLLFSLAINAIIKLRISRSARNVVSNSTPTGLSRVASYCVWRVGGHIFHRFHLWLLSRSARNVVSNSTPTGLSRVASYCVWRVGGHICHRFHLWLLSRSARNVVSNSTPTGLARVGGHIFHRFHLWLFKFNPYGVGARWGRIFHRFHLWLLSRSARNVVSNSTPTGLGPSPALSPGFP
jgi:hypothetical protein